MTDCAWCKVSIPDDERVTVVAPGALIGTVAGRVDAILCSGPISVYHNPCWAKMMRGEHEQLPS